MLKSWLFKASIIILPFILLGPRIVFASWPMYGYNFTHTHATTYNISKPLEVLWNSENLSSIGGPPTVDEEGNIYIPSYNTGLVTLDKNGHKIWEFTSFIPSKNVVLDSNNNIYYSTSGCNPFVYALNKVGQKIWDYDLRHDSGQCGWNQSNTGIAISRDKKTLYLGVDYYWQSILAFNLDGSLKWATSLGGSYPSTSGIAVGEDETIYVGSRPGGALFAISKDGVIKWTANIAGGVTLNLSTPSLDQDGNIYAFTSGAAGGEVLASYTSGGIKRWSYQVTNSSFNSDPAIFNNVIYIPEENNLLAIDTKTGNLIWKWISPDLYYLTSPAVDKNGLILISSYNKIFAINPNGSTKWIKDFLDPINTLIISDNDLIYTFQNEGWDGHLIALGIKPPEPFLDLPWDYQSKGLSFNDAALAINSYFDHEYPLLSSGLSEPSGISLNIIDFRGPPRNGNAYSSHDGYDYGKKAKVNLGDPVLAAASGSATFVNTCSACGNMIVIDHGNGYQTRYLHLQKDGLIISTPSASVQVSAGQKIGKVGATGNVSPAGDSGAHIHFGVFQDKNSDGNFEDNVPDGVTDPFGWQAKVVDPWENYSFFYNGQNHIGNKSYYLWKKKLDNLNTTLTSNGGVFNINHYNLNFPAGATNQNLTLQVSSAPASPPSNNLLILVPAILANTYDALGNLVDQFSSVYTITVDFVSADLERTKQDTISFYSSVDGIIWKKEATSVDLQNHKATTSVNHMTYFALMAERADTTPPTTTAKLNKNQIILSAEDNIGGLGVDYTLYKLDDNDWDTYISPLTFTTEDKHKLQFYSVDKDENIENVKTYEFNVDLTPPEFKVHFNPGSLKWEPSSIDNLATPSSELNKTGTFKGQFIATDSATNRSLLLYENTRKDNKLLLTGTSISYNGNPATNFGSNAFAIEYSLASDTNKLSKLYQALYIQNFVKITIEYLSLTNQSQISTETPQGKQTETKGGLVILNAYTEKGTIKYSY